MRDFIEGCCNAVTRGCSWHDVVSGDELDCVRDTVTAGAGDIDLEVAVVAHGRADEPAQLSMNRPGAALLGAFMDDNFGAQGGEGSSIVVEDSKHLVMCGQFWIDA